MAQVQLKLDCPHTFCRTKNAGVILVFSYALGDHNWATLGRCMACDHGLVLTINCRHSSGPHAITLQDYQKYGGEVLFVFPSPPSMEEIEDLPGPIDSLWKEAELAFANGNQNTLVGMALRAVMERAIKFLRPNGDGSLWKRIESMKDVVPPDLIELMHEIRFLGNDAVHEVDPTADNISEARDMIRLFLVYAFELPARVNRLRHIRQSGLSTPS